MEYYLAVRLGRCGGSERAKSFPSRACLSCVIGEIAANLKAENEVHIYRT